MPLVTHVGGGTNAQVLRARVGRAPADRVRRVRVTARGLVAHLRRRVRAAPRSEARHHRDAGQLVPAHRRSSSTRSTASTTRSATNR